VTAAECQAAFDQNKDAVYRFAWRMSGSAAVARDITQDVFVGLPRYRRVHRTLEGRLDMEDRRTFLGIAASLLPASLLPLALEAQTATPQGAAGPRRDSELARHALTGPLEGFEATVTEVILPPRTPGAPPQPAAGHRHSGFVLGYVLEGQLRFAVNHEAERVVPAGSAFFEPIGALHTTNGSASTEAGVRFLAFLVVPKGSPIVLPA
jgi:quercetin dioxygenase-like cupin family protein